MSADSPISADTARTFGTQLKAARERRGLSQETVANAAGISRNHLQLIEAGLSDRARRSPANPRLSTLLALCQAVGVTARIDASAPTGLVVEVEPAPTETAPGG